MPQNLIRGIRTLGVGKQSVLSVGDVEHSAVATVVDVALRVVLGHVELDVDAASDRSVDATRSRSCETTGHDVARSATGSQSSLLS